jgi:hypothetical protein
MSVAATVPIPAVPRLATVRNLVRARQACQALEAWLMSEESRQLPLHEVEREQDRRGRELQRLLLEAHVAQRGPGDVGPAIEVGAVDGLGAGTLPPHRRLDPCHPQTIFGEITSERTGDRRPGAAAVHPWDDQWQRPRRSFSDERQRRVVQAAVQGPVAEATPRVADLTGVVVPKRSAEVLVQEAARECETFYQTRLPPPAVETGPILVASLDGQGVPMVKAAPAARVVRRGTGEQAQQQKMAVVAPVYTQQPRLRTPQAVCESLLGLAPAEESSQPRERPEYKRVWASLVQGTAGLMDEVVQELKRRDPVRQKHWVVLTEGERALQQSVKRRLRSVPLVRDVQHVLAKRWSAVYAVHEAGRPTAVAWVQERAWRRLHGEGRQVVQGRRVSVTTRQLRGQKRKGVEAAARSFYRHRRHMRDDEDLRQGGPMATGGVEGAGKNLVKDRMERSGMRWTPAMAEAMLTLRATYLSGAFEAYWAFHIAREHERLHPSGSWQPAHIIEEK